MDSQPLTQSQDQKRRRSRSSSSSNESFSTISSVFEDGETGQLVPLGSENGDNDNPSSAKVLEEGLGKVATALSGVAAADRVAPAPPHRNQPERAVPAAGRQANGQFGGPRSGPNSKKKRAPGNEDGQSGNNTTRHRRSAGPIAHYYLRKRKPKR